MFIICLFLLSTLTLVYFDFSGLTSIFRSKAGNFGPNNETTNDPEYRHNSHWLDEPILPPPDEFSSHSKTTTTTTTTNNSMNDPFFYGGAQRMRFSDDDDDEQDSEDPVAVEAEAVRVGQSRHVGYYDATSLYPSSG